MQETYGGKKPTQGWRRYRPVLGVEDAKVRHEVIPGCFGERKPPSHMAGAEDRRDLQSC